MKSQSSEETPREPVRPRAYVVMLAAALLVISLLLWHQHNHHNVPASTNAQPSTAPKGITNNKVPVARGFRPGAVATEPNLSAKEIVTRKVRQFARNRRKLAHEIAKQVNKPVPPEFEQFFDAAEAGNYDEMTALYQSFRKQRETGASESWYGPHWHTIVETQGVADAAHTWPAQQLLDYGNSLLGALRPGMIYAGSAETSFSIPTLLNETSDGDHFTTVNQSALADRTYIEYLRYLHKDRLSSITDEQSDHAFEDYLKDAQKRLQHDQLFPNEPKQIRPGENVRVEENRVQVSGQTAVMSINEKLLQALMQNNPGLSFALADPSPFPSLSANATLLGPITEVGGQNQQNVLTPERANQALGDWRVTMQQVLSDPETTDTSDPRKAYSRLAQSQAALFLAHNYASEAEQAYQIATQFWPANPEALAGYTKILADQNRFDEALRIVDNALSANPVNNRLTELRQNLLKRGK